MLNSVNRNLSGEDNNPRKILSQETITTQLGPVETYYVVLAIVPLPRRADVS